MTACLFPGTGGLTMSTACVTVALPWWGPAEPLRCLESDLERERAELNLPLKRGVCSVGSVTSWLEPASCSSSSPFSSSSSSSRSSPACKLVSQVDECDNDCGVQNARTTTGNLWNYWASEVLQYLVHLRGVLHNSVENHPVHGCVQMQDQADGKGQRMK